MRQICLDTETTGLFFYLGHRIVEIGCVEILDKKITNNIYHTYLNPSRDIEKEAFEVTGITNDFLKDKPKFSDIVEDFFCFLNGADEIIIHNSDFDVNFINNELRLINYKFKDIRLEFNIFNTLSFSRMYLNEKKNSLDALCKKYNIDNSERNLHGALTDAKLLAKLYLEMSNEPEFYVFKKRCYESKQLNKTAIFKTLKTSECDLNNHLEYIKRMKYDE